MSENNSDSAEPDQMLERVRELAKQGFDFYQSWGRAALEEKIKNWPPSFGNDLRIVIYGDFEPPPADLHLPSLGITVHHEKLKGSITKSALCALNATVTMSEKSISAIIDAVQRINVLLGAWTLVNRGLACGWWSCITHGMMGGAVKNLDYEDLHGAVEGITNLSDKVRRKIVAAFYWVREPRNLMRDGYRSDVLKIYAGYWDAFECLVDAVNILRPPSKHTKSQKQKQIDEFVAALKGKLTSADIDQCFHKIVNTGLVGKASHALTVCFPGEAEKYIDECFRMQDKHNRLYNIRNAINHGEIDAEHPEELLRVESRLPHLSMIVWGMFDWLIPFPAPTESNQEK
jgi:hypothetical protein